MESESTIKSSINTKTENTVTNNSTTDKMDQILEETRRIRSDEGILDSFQNQKTSETKNTDNTHSSSN